MITTRHDCNATLVSRQDLNEDLAIVHVRPDAGEVPDFSPGQYALVGLPQEGERRSNGRPKMLRRAYSIASSPAEKEALEFYIVRIRDGRLTPGLWQVPAGGRVWLDPRGRGQFTLDGVPRGIDLVLVATGTGIAPFISMLRTYRGQDRWRNLVILHGVRYTDDLGYEQEIEAARRDDPSIVYVPTVTREPADSGWTGPRGRVQELLRPGVFSRHTGISLDPLTSYVFLCGHPDMIRTTSEQLAERGFEPRSKDAVGSMHFEKYW